jgi:F420-non-reducing hydrogenase large subunit
MRRVSIDPITRLEGHGRIDMYLDDAGAVSAAYLMIPELRGFEKFLEGRPVEDLPLITQRICGVCPEAHHAASAKAVDAVYGLTIPRAAEVLRRLQYSAFTAGDHATHFFALGGPDLIMGPDADPAERNVVGVLRKVGPDLAHKVIRVRREAHEIAELLGGRRVHPVSMAPGGFSQPVSAETAARMREIAAFVLEFAKEAQVILAQTLEASPVFKEMLFSEAYTSRTCYMSLVNELNQPDSYDGMVRIVGPDGTEIAKYEPADYLQYFAERSEPWSYLKFPYLKSLGWRGTDDGAAGSIIRSGPLGMLNAADAMQTPLAQEEFEKFHAVMGSGPVHQTLAFHWARLIEMLQSAELLAIHANDEAIMDRDVRVLPGAPVGEGVGCVEAPRGLLTHHYATDENGIVTSVNLIVGTTYNYPAIQASVAKAAKSLIDGGAELTEALMNRIEMAFRAYDPCFGCATHAMFGTGPFKLRVIDSAGAVVRVLHRDENGRVVLSEGEES